MLLGVITGISLTLGGGLAVFKSYREAKRPKRYTVTVDPDNRYFVQGHDHGAQLYAAASLDRIFKDGNALLRPQITKAVDLSAAGHEYESFQIVVKAGENPVKGVALEISDLVRENGGATIDRKNITWRVVGYVPTIQPYYPVKYVGEWPDPLLPPTKVDIDEDQTQPFWVTVYVPPSTLPGFYRGTVTFSADGINPQAIPVRLTVFNFTLPLEGSLKTAFDFYGHETFRRYPRGEKEEENTYQERLGNINNKFIIEMLKYRLNPILNIDPTIDGELGLVDRYRVYGLNNFSIGKRGGTLGNNWPDKDSDIEGLLGLYRTYGEMLKLNKMLQFTYIYTWDEGAIGNPKVAKLCSMVHRAYSGLKNMVCYHGFWDPDKNPKWGKDIDIWTFQIDSFDESAMRKLQKIGKEIWMYISGPAGTGSPNLAMDFDSIDYRIIPWLCWKYDIRGFLYWCVNWWPYSDPFKTANNSQWEQNGTGLLFYPGEDGPIASLRVEIFRDGMEDYEYIQILMKKLQSLKQNGLTDQEKKFIEGSAKLLTIDESIASSMSSFVKNGETLQDRRNAIARKIEEFDRDF